MPNWRDRITVNPDICHGKACFEGTRVMVSIVLDNLAGGTTRAGIHEMYPTLPDDAIEAALAYAADLGDREG